MRKLTAVGAIAAGMLGMSLQANATQVINDITGVSGSVEMTCTQIIWSFDTADCTYGRNRENTDAPGAWVGFAKNGGYFPIGSVGDDVNFSADSAAAIPLFIQPTITGDLTIDDNGTPADGSDDTIWMEFTMGAAARNVATGQFTRAVQRWTTMVNQMPKNLNGDPIPIPVHSATPNGSGGFDYVIGSRGFPTYDLCAKANNTDCFPSVNAPTGATFPRFWSAVPPGGTSAIPAQGSIGIERSGELAGPGWAAPPDPASSTPGNLGAQTTATFTDYSCNTNNTSSDDCTFSPIVWGAAEDPGFDNLIAKISTDSNGNVISAKMFWTQEYFIGAFGGIVGFDNSEQSGVFTFTGIVQGSGAVDDSFSVLQDSNNNILNVTANDKGFTGTETVSIVTPPTHGTASVNGSNEIVYTPNAGYVGPDSLVYQGTDGTLTDDANVTITVAADVSPVAPDGAISISTQGVAPASTSGSLNLTTLAGYSAGNSPAVVTLTAPAAANGTVAVVGTTVTYTPNATFFQGSDQFGYTITDADGDTDSGVITVTIPNVAPVISDGSITTDQNVASAPFTPAITLGNGSAAQNLLTVTTQATNGTCVVNPGNGSGKVVYTPNQDFFGTDTCTLTLIDGDGQSDTAVINVSVNEVSNDLILPGGGSAMDLWSLSLLAGLPLVRRRRPD